MCYSRLTYFKISRMQELILHAKTVSIVPREWFIRLFKGPWKAFKAICDGIQGLFTETSSGQKTENCQTGQRLPKSTPELVLIGYQDEKDESSW